MRNLTASVAVFAALITTAPASHARPVGSTDAPVDRLIKNTEAFLKKNPKDADAHFTLGRIHYFAFALGREQIPTLRWTDTRPVGPYTTTSNPGRVFSNQTSYGRTGSGQKLTEAARRTHLRAALTHLQRAIVLRDAAERATPGKRLSDSDSRPGLSPDRAGLYDLCLACVYEDGKTLLSKDWRAKAIALYRRAYERSAPSDLKSDTQPIFGYNTLVSYEAANSYIRLVTQRGPTPAEKVRIAQFKRGVSQLEAKPSGAVTPIVFSLTRPVSLTRLLRDSGSSVAFDLDGTGRPQWYRWTRPDTAILVWDPAGTGRITSGRQLFGSATWWLFWEDGYRALAALDDNNNGWLEGQETQGLALWFDRDSDGVSDRGEVVPLSQSPVVALATAATGSTAGAPMNAHGLRLRNGKTLPTYDWVATPLPKPPAARQRQ